MQLVQYEMVWTTRYFQQLANLWNKRAKSPLEVSSDEEESERLLLANTQRKELPIEISSKPKEANRLALIGQTEAKSPIIILSDSEDEEHLHGRGAMATSMVVHDTNSETSTDSGMDVSTKSDNDRAPPDMPTRPYTSTSFDYIPDSVITKEY